MASRESRPPRADSLRRSAKRTNSSSRLAASSRASPSSSPPGSAGSGPRGGYPDGLAVSAPLAPPPDGLPRQLQGVPDSLRSWWQRVDPRELQRVSLCSGRTDVIRALCRRLGAQDRILDLGCGCGLLAKEAARRDIVGVDMAPAMIQAAREWMDEVVPDNILEHFPAMRFDTVVLCNVLESYPRDIWHLMCRHSFDFLVPGGQVLIAIAMPGGESAIDLVLPKSGGDSASPDELEQALLEADFEIGDAELISTTAQSQEAAVQGERPERYMYAVISGLKPADGA